MTKEKRISTITMPMAIKLISMVTYRKEEASKNEFT